MTTSPQPVQRIFVSHSSKDNDFDVQLVEDLRRILGDESAVWYDAKRGLNPGDQWFQKIENEVIARDIFLIVLSPDAMNSAWVRREFDIALNEKKRIIPVLYRSYQVWPYLRTVHHVSYLPPRTYEAAFDELLTTLGLPPDVQPAKPASTPTDPTTAIVRQMTPQIEAAFAEQDWPMVIRRANLLIKRAPDAASSNIYRMQGVALREEGYMQLAQDALDTSLTLVDDRQERLTILRDYADLLAAQDQWSEVLRYAREALRLAPNDPTWLATQQQAQTKLQGETPVPPKPRGLGQTRRQETLPTPQKTKEQWLEEGNAHYNAKRYQEAIAAYDRAIELDSTYAMAYFKRGDTYDEAKDYQKAIADYSRAIQLNPKDATTYYYQGITYGNLKEYEKAIAAYDRVIQLDSKNTIAYNNRGNAYKALKEYQKAIADFDRAIQLDPKFALAYSNRGATYDDLKEYQKAIADFDRAIQLDPNIDTAYAGRGEAYRLLKEYQRAIQDFDRAIELDPTYAWAYGSRGQVYSSLKQYQRAIQDFDRALELDPSAN